MEARAERDIRDRTEQAAQLRRQLPLGGVVPTSGTLWEL